MTSITSDADRAHRIYLATRIVSDEVARIITENPPFNSTHEGYSIIHEELDETWDEVKANNRSAAIDEAVQVAATAIRFVAELGALDALTARVSDIELREIEAAWGVEPEPVAEVIDAAVEVTPAPAPEPAPVEAKPPTLAELLARTTARLAAKNA